MTNNTNFGGGGNTCDMENGQGVDIDLDDQNTIEQALQCHINQQLLSSSTDQRHDSLFTCSSLGTPRHSVSQHQAEPQPYANIHQNLHSPNAYSQHPVNDAMSRSISQRSSTSSGQRPHLYSLQQGPRGSFGSNFVSTGSDMSRTISSTSANQRNAPQSYPLQSHSQVGHFHTRRSSDLSPNMGYEQFPTNTMSPFNFGANDAIAEDVFGFEEENRTFGQVAYGNESSNLLSTFTSISHASKTSFGEQTPYQNPPHTSPSQHILTAAFPQQTSRSPIHSPPPPISPHPIRRRRHTSTPPSPHTDPIIGQVTLSGKFKCLNKTCVDDDGGLTFNRHADFKHHHDNTHAKWCVEYFCSEAGCPRSRNPGGGRKGRGFRGRRDKRDEHWKAVHEKGGRKRKRGVEGDEWVEEGGCDGGDVGEEDGEGKGRERGSE